MPQTALLESYRSWLARLAAAEQGDGWLEACDRAGRFLVPCREFVQSLAELLAGLAGGRRVLEVCAGSGELAEALTDAGLNVVATDAEPPAEKGTGTFCAKHPSGLSGKGCLSPFPDRVLPMSAVEALREHRPAVVLGAFVPFDAHVDREVMDCPSVEHYVVLNARFGGTLGSSELWNRGDWSAHELESVRSWMLTRHDVWLGPAPEDVLRHGDAWHFRREGRTR